MTEEEGPENDQCADAPISETVTRVAGSATFMPPVTGGFNCQHPPTICQMAVTHEVDQAKVLPVSLAERSELTKRGGKRRHYQAENFRLRWLSIIEALVGAPEDDNVRAFEMVLEEGFGVPPWTVLGTMSLADLVDRDEKIVPPTGFKPLSESGRD